jgi:hypothetical protein
VFRSLRVQRSQAIVLILGAAAGICFSGPQARAGDLDLLVFGSMDGGIPSFGSSGAKVALKEGGPALLASVGAGQQSEIVAPAMGIRHAVQRTVATAAVVFGYQWFREWGVLGAFLGPEGSLSRLTDGAATASQTVETGLRLQGEAWVRPNESSLIQATLIASTTRRSVWTRLAGGLRVEEGYLGPEIGLYADATGYRKWTFGFHATDYMVAGLHLRVTLGGQIRPESRHMAPYVGLTTWESW